MKTVKVNRAGGPVTAEVRSGHAQTGSYELRLWAADDNVVLLRREGNFLNDADDSYELPGTAADNDRRIVQAIVVLVLTPPVFNYHAELIVSQDGSEVERESYSGASAEPSVVLNIFLTLSV